MQPARDGVGSSPHIYRAQELSDLMEFAAATLEEWVNDTTTRWYSSFAPWARLPSEIQETILSLACRNIIDEYDIYGGAPFGERWRSYVDQAEKPEPPEPLLRYTQLVLTSRQFYNSIRYVIKFEGATMPKILRRMQFFKLREMFQRIRDEPDGDSGRCYRIAPVIIRFVGFFWNNPLVRRHNALIWKLFKTVSYDDAANLLPFFESYFTSLLQHQQARTSEWTEPLAQWIYPVCLPGTSEINASKIYFLTDDYFTIEDRMRVMQISKVHSLELGSGARRQVRVNGVVDYSARDLYGIFPHLLCR